MKRTWTAGFITAVLFLAGCSTGGTTDPTGSTSTKPSTPTSMSPTTTTSQADRNAAAAGKAVVAMWAVIDRVGADPKSKIEDLTTVARGVENAQWTKNLFDRRNRGERFIGHTSVTISSATPGTKTGEYVVDACLDVSKLNVVDAEGKSIVPADRQPTIRYVYGVSQDGGSEEWFVTSEKVSGSC